MKKTNNTTNSSIEIDCVELMHSGAGDIRMELQGKNKKEVLEYWEGKNREFLELKSRLMQKKHKVA
ncbi:MAG: hypothetical protein HQM09_22760 [Candidatus Riflebacteria bacterium]|nr:hypothetical protein [Candidatus Riflebacteria bacterium]